MNGPGPGASPVLQRAGRALPLRPVVPKVHNNLGNALRDNGQCDGAVVACRRAIALKPDYGEAHTNLGNALKERGQLAEALGCYRRAVLLKPGDSFLHSNLLYTELFNPDSDPLALRAQAEHWERLHVLPLAKPGQSFAHMPEPGRRVKVGYVSPDFCRHVISHFLTPLLEAHDHAQFEIYCYASVKRPDAVTERMKRTADVWRDVLGLPDGALADRIREDGIDILVDLTQHMSDNRMPVFARKPAPIQVAWLGYPGTTGLRSIDYRFTDACMEPEGSTWSESVETPVRLPDSWFCFDPIDEYPEPGPLPAIRAGHVTFGSLNNFCKVNAAVLQLWAEVMRNVEGSRLLLQCPPGETEAKMREWFEGQGIAAHRLELVPRTPSRAEFLQRFDRIDIALETFPYNGGTTTCEALWMGVPAPTFPGRATVSRIGLSILSAAGLPQMIADGRDDYIRLVTSLAGDLPRLSAWRSTLRGRMKASAFMDAPRFARNVEHAYRQMWRTWCAKQTSASKT